MERERMKTHTLRQTIASLVTVVAGARLDLSDGLHTMTRHILSGGWSMSALLITTLLGALVSQNVAAAEPTSRPFRMGFTGFVYDTTPEAVSRLAEICSRERGHPCPSHRRSPLDAGVEWPTLPQSPARRMGGQEIGDAAKGKNLPGHLAWARRTEGRGQSRAAAGGAQGKALRRSVGDEGLSRLLPAGDRVL